MFSSILVFSITLAIQVFIHPSTHPSICPGLGPSESSPSILVVFIHSDLHVSVWVFFLCPSWCSSSVWVFFICLFIWVFSIRPCLVHPPWSSSSIHLSILIFICSSGSSSSVHLDVIHPSGSSPCVRGGHLHLSVHLDVLHPSWSSSMYPSILVLSITLAIQVFIHPSIHLSWSQSIRVFSILPGRLHPS